MTNQRFYPGETIDLQYQTSNNGALVDPDTVTLKWKQTRQGSENFETVSNPSTGVHTASIKPLKLGPVHFRWEAVNPDSIEEGTINVRPGNFTETGFFDYV